jgi:acetylornithine deacetylase
VPPLPDAEVLRRLVAFDTTSHRSNLGLCDFVANYLDRPGTVVHRHPSPEGDKATLIVRLGPESGDPAQGLTLCGHTDVVPAEEPEWTGDPFTLRETDDAYVGRGACDMKGFLALAVNAAARLDPRRVRRPLALLLTHDEELGTAGARHFVETWTGPPLPRDTVIGEPTELAVVHAHKGLLQLRITVEGRAAHGGYPHLGVNAIEPAGRIIVALSELGRELEAERPSSSDAFPDVPYPALNIGRVAGGRAMNVVPDRCVIELGIRILPGTASGAMVARVRERLADVASRCDLEIVSDSPPLWADPSAGLCRTLCGIVSQPHARTVSYATDGGWLGQAGYYCVVFGPGSIAAAHQPNEWLPKAAFASGGSALERLVHHSCLTEEA